jgi:hypothetical protein
MAAMDFKRWSHGEKIWGLDPVGYLENCSFIDDKHIYIFNIYIFMTSLPLKTGDLQTIKHSNRES